LQLCLFILLDAGHWSLRPPPQNKKNTHKTTHFIPKYPSEHQILPTPIQPPATYHKTYPTTYNLTLQCLLWDLNVTIINN